MIILASNDGGFFYGLASYNQSNNDKLKKDNVEIKIDKSSMVQCFSFKWPYICFKSLIDNHLMIIDCNEPDLIHNVELPKRVDKFMDSFITE